MIRFLQFAGCDIDLLYYFKLLYFFKSEII